MEVGEVKTELVGMDGANQTGAALKGFGGEGLGIVMGQHEAVGIFDDFAAAAIVGEKRDDMRVLRKIMFEIEKIFNIRTSETVDGLPIVANGEEFELWVKVAEGLDEAKEREREVLVLVDHEVTQWILAEMIGGVGRRTGCGRG